jgi:hypothetical protein
VKYTGFDPEPLPPEIEKQITTPHDHEGPNNSPVWLFWLVDIGRDGLSDGPQLLCVADSERSARYHAAMYLDSNVDGRRGTGGEAHLHLERVPTNHTFGGQDLKAFYEFYEMSVRRATMIRFHHKDEREKRGW